MDAIKESVQSTQTVLMGKMENLWDLYNQKIKAFENTDDAYKDLALDLKYKYTTFFERAGEGFVAPVKDFYDIGRGFFVEAFHMVSGVALISWDIGIVAVSSQIPDPIEPAFLKNKNDAIIEDYTNAALQLKEDPMMAVELMAQSMSDTVEEEGVMYVSGSALTYLIPTSLFVKFIKEGSAVKGVGKARIEGGNKRTKGNRLITSVDDLSDTAKSKISTSQRASLNQQDRTYLHLTEMDLKGAQRDLDGNPVPKPGGGYYDHAQEVSDAYRSLSDLKKSWEGVLKNPNLDAELRQLYTSMLIEVNVTMKKVDNMFAPYGGVNQPK